MLIRKIFICMISLLITDCTLASDDMTIPEKTKHTEKLYTKLSKCINSDNNFPSLDTAISLDIDPSHEINAFSSQGKIVITAGLLKIANSDEFIAFVLSHEISHHIYQHLEKQRNFSPGENFEDRVAFALQRGIAMEVEADRLGLEIMQQCGFDTANARETLEILLNENSSKGNDTTTGLLYFERMKHLHPKKIPAK